MPRDDNKGNGRSRGPRSGPPRGKGGFGAGSQKREGGRSEGRSAGPRSRDDRPARSSAPSGDRKFGDKKFGDKPFGEKRPYKPREDRSDRPFKPREERGERSFKPRDGGDRPFKPRDRDDRAPRAAGRFDDKKFGEKRPYKPREDRGEGRAPFKPREDRGDRPFKPRDGGDRPPRAAGRFDDKKFGEKRPYKPREDRGEGRAPYKPREDGGDRPFKPREDRGERSFKPRDGGDRPPRRDSSDRPPRSAGRFDDKKFGGKRPYKPREDRGEGRAPYKPREDRGDRPFKPREDRGERSFKPRDGGDRPFKPRDRDDRAPRREYGDHPERAERSDRGPRKFDRPREDRPREDRAPRARGDWQEHPRSEGEDRPRDRERRENEDDSQIFAKRPAFGGRGEYRERKPDTDRRAPRAEPVAKKAGERIAKLISRAGLCSRRDAEEWVTQGRVSVNGRVINSPALDVTSNDKVLIDGNPLPERERTRLFLYHKPKGLMTTHDDPEGRPTVFDNLPEGLPRLISIGRLDFNTEGLLLLTNDGGLARTLELPDTGWLRRYRVRAHGEVTQAQLDTLKKGVEVDGVKYGSIDATLERDQGSNVWIVFAIREGKNREVRNVMAHLGLEVNRLIRISYGPFQLAEIAEGQAEEVKTRVLRDQLGDRIAMLSGADFKIPEQRKEADAEDGAPRGKKPFKPKGKSGLIADRKGRRVLVTRSGSDEARARNEDEAAASGPPKRPRRGYHGKRDLTPLDE